MANITLSKRYGPWAVVTGASEGIGRAFAVCLAEAGIHVVLVARREAVLAEFSDELVLRFGIGTHVVAADLGSPAGIQSLLGATCTLDVGLLVAAAGFGTSGEFVSAPLDNELAMIDVNCRAVAELTHHYAARFVERGRGGLVLMSSIVAFQGVPRAANYAATKAFVQTFAEGIRAELSPLGVDVIASAPGPVHSGFAQRASMTMTQAASPRTVAEQTLAALGRTTTVRPGWLARVLGLSLSMLPRWARVRMMGVVMAGMANGAPPSPPIAQDSA